MSDTDGEESLISPSEYNLTFGDNCNEQQQALADLTNKHALVVRDLHAFYQEEIDQLQSQLKNTELRLRESTDRLQKEISWRALADKHTKQNNQQSKLQHDEILKLKGQVYQKDAELQTLQSSTSKTIASLQAELLSVNNDNANLKARIQQLNTQLHAEQRKTATLTVELATAHDESDFLRHQVQQLIEREASRRPLPPTPQQYPSSDQLEHEDKVVARPPPEAAPEAKQHRLPASEQPSRQNHNMNMLSGVRRESEHKEVRAQPARPERTRSLGTEHVPGTHGYPGFEPARRRQPRSRKSNRPYKASEDAPFATDISTAPDERVSELNTAISQLCWEKDKAEEQLTQLSRKHVRSNAGLLKRERLEKDIHGLERRINKLKFQLRQHLSQR